VAGTEEIKHWVLKWGANAEVLAPESLRQEIRREAEEMIKIYASGKTRKPGLTAKMSRTSTRR
jgi:hypothetical protein